METLVNDASSTDSHLVATVSVHGVVSSRAAGPDLLRALAILLVMLWHLPRSATPALLEGLKPYGWTGVDLFFVLSGYLSGISFYYPAAPGFRGPVLTLVGPIFGYPLLSFGFACLLVASLDWERVFGTWRVPGAGTIAITSYSIHLTHKLVTHSVVLLLGEDVMMGLSGFAIYFLTGISVGTLFWWVVERPFLLLRDRILSPSR